MEKISFVLLVNINSFFHKGDMVTLVSDWGDLAYISKGIHRTAVDKKELKVRK